MNNIGLSARLDNIKKKMTMEKNEDLKKQKEELIETLFAVDKNEEVVEVTNSEIFSLKEWKSWSKERQESVILFIHMATDIKDAQNIVRESTFDRETSLFMAKQGFKKVLLNM